MKCNSLRSRHTNDVGGYKFFIKSKESKNFISVSNISLINFFPSIKFHKIVFILSLNNNKSDTFRAQAKWLKLITFYPSIISKIFDKIIIFSQLFMFNYIDIFKFFIFLDRN
jgi:hypothetical protein